MKSKERSKKDRKVTTKKVPASGSAQDDGGVTNGKHEKRKRTGKRILTSGCEEDDKGTKGEVNNQNTKKRKITHKTILTIGLDDYDGGTKGDLYNNTGTRNMNQEIDLTSGFEEDKVVIDQNSESENVKESEMIEEVLKSNLEEAKPENPNNNPQATDLGNEKKKIGNFRKWPDQ